MKTIIGTNSNFFIALDDDHKPIPSVEVVLILGEPQYRLDHDSKNISKVHATETVRFVTSLEGLEDMIEEFENTVCLCEDIFQDAANKAAEATQPQPEVQS